MASNLLTTTMLLLLPRSLMLAAALLTEPGKELGIVAVEAIASGKPLIGLGRGGILESVPTTDPHAGFFYDEPGEENLEEAVLSFERQESSIRSYELQTAALRFSEERFAEGMRSVILAEFQEFEQSARHPIHVADLETPVPGLLRLQ